MRLTENARLVLERRYLLRDKDGKVKETPEGMFRRVAEYVSRPEKKAAAKWAERFHDLMAGLRFLPNSPTLMNAGKANAQLSACFVLPIDDSLDGIFGSLGIAAKVHQSGGGTGFGFSHLRPAGSVVRSTHGVASGPVSFMRIYDAATETIKQGGARRGANMAILRVDHPDILEFVNVKRDRHSVQNFNLSVGATDEFMGALRENASFALRDPRSGREVKRVQAQAVFSEIVASAWECGDPGLVFLDRINLFNPTPDAGDMESTNPCGEQPLLPFESCNLGSLNLAAYHREDRGMDWERLREDVHLAVRFLDNVIEMNDFPVPQTARITRKNRKIGLGVMGFADLLLEAGVAYDSEDGRRFGERVMSLIDREAKKASAGLARERSRFPNWNGSIWKRLGYPPLRNATVSTVAPTGTISMIAGVSSGIEPIFSAVTYRNVLSGERLLEIHPAVERVLKAQGLRVGDLSEEKLSLALIEALGPAWKTARTVGVDDHVRMQAAFQRHSDSAVSKTVNLPESATTSDVERAYLLAYRLGCKGITVYRDRSRPTQVLESAGPGDEFCESTD